MTIKSWTIANPETDGHITWHHTGYSDAVEGRAFSTFLNPITLTM